MLAVITYQNMPRIKAPPIVDFHDIGKGFALSDLPIMQNAEIHWDGEPVVPWWSRKHSREEHAASLVSVEYDAETPEVSFEGAKSKAVVPRASWVNLRKSKSATRRRLSRRRKSTSAIFIARPAITTVDRAACHHCRLERRRKPAGFRCHAIRQPDRAHAGVCIRPQDGRCPRGRAISWRWFRRQNRLEQHALCVAAAKVVNRPVKLALTREDTFRMVGGRTISEQYVGLGAQNDGKLTALIHTGLTATTLSGRYAEQFSFPPRHLYAMQSYRIGQQVTTRIAWRIRSCARQESRLAPLRSRARSMRLPTN